MRLPVVLTTAAFFIWLLPLGVFIKPSQEKIACDGQRAICLCHTQFLKSKSGAAGKPMLSQNSGANKEAAAHGGGANQFLAAHLPAVARAAGLRLFEHPFLPYSLLICKSIEHIPKP